MVQDYCSRQGVELLFVFKILLNIELVSIGIKEEMLARYWKGMIIEEIVRE